MAPKLSPKFLAIGGVIYIATSSATYLYLKKGKPPSCSCPSHGTSSASTTDTFDRIARDYDDNINFDELLMGVKLLRRRLAGQAKGDVLEVSAGTGRNLSYYYKSPNISSVTLTDASREMLLRAHEKYSEAVAKAEKKENKNGVPRTYFLLADVENLCLDTNKDSRGTNAVEQSLNGDRIPRKGEEERIKAAPKIEPPPAQQEEDEPLTRYGPALKTVHQLTPGAYDTVVDTFGLCSCEDPVKALREMVKALKPGGQLLLLEHGRGTWNFINKILDSSAEEHRKKWGCLWNRDIEGLIKEAGLVVDSIERWHFGTTYVIRCKKE